MATLSTTHGEELRLPDAVSSQLGTLLDLLDAAPSRDLGRDPMLHYMDDAAGGRWFTIFEGRDSMMVKTPTGAEHQVALPDIRTLVNQDDVQQFEGMYFLDWTPSEEFSQKFKARYGTDPLYETQNSYEIIRSISKALESGVPDLRQALAQVVYDGVSGKVDFKSSNFPNLGQAKLFRVHNGAFVE